MRKLKPREDQQRDLDHTASRGRHLHRKQRSFCSLPTANAKSLLWDLYRYSWATLCHFPRSRGDGELLSPDDVQAGALPPVGQGPTFSMRPGDGWVRAPKGLAGRVLDWGNSPGKNSPGVGCLAFLQGIFPTQGSNLHPLSVLHRIITSILPRGKLRHRVIKSRPKSAHSKAGI